MGMRREEMEEGRDRREEKERKEERRDERKDERKERNDRVLRYEKRVIERVLLRSQPIMVSLRFFDFSI